MITPSIIIAIAQILRVVNFSLNNIKNENFLDKNFDDFDVRNLYVGAFLEKKAKRYYM